MFELLKTDATSKARLGRLTTPHGVVDTPVFMSVGTQGSVKAIDPRELREMGTQIILGNTYHLNIRPGLDIIRAAGGLHRFINWERPILTDSGGFQVFSLATIRKIQAHGVEFRSHLDGSLLFLGPKEAMAIQAVLGSDIAMVFDDCPPHTSTPRELRAAVERTMRWAAECREQPRAPGQMVFGIVQGGTNAALREECAKALVALKFDGYAIGGVSVGEPEPEMMRAVEMTEPLLPANQPRYAMGLGTPAQMVELVARGVDMFDCVLPTRVARNGTAFTRKGSVSIKAGACKADFRPDRGRLRLLRLPAFHAGVFAAPAQRGRNPRPAHAERPQHADVSADDGGDAGGDCGGHVCRVPARVRGQLRADEEGPAGPRRGGGTVNVAGAGADGGARMARARPRGGVSAARSRPRPCPEGTSDNSPAFQRRGPLT